MNVDFTRVSRCLRSAFLGLTLWTIPSAQSIDISPLVVRNLSVANIEPLPIANADHYAITSDSVDKILPWLLGCAQYSYMDMKGIGQGDLVYRDGAVATGSKTDAYETSWPSRALVAYTRVRHLATTSQRDSIDRWFLRNAAFTMEHMSSFLKLNFPGRDSDNYSIRWRDASKPNFYGLVTVKDGDTIPLLSQWYNNRRSLAHFYLLLTGIAFSEVQKDSSRKYLAEVKRYIKEWITYSVFPTGETGEWARNHEYPNKYGEYIEAQGIHYNSYNSTLAITAALLLKLRFNDDELVKFSTRAGLWGTECQPNEPPKTIWTASDLHISLFDTNVVRYNRVGARIQVLYNYSGTEDPLRAELMHPSWYLPAYRSLRPVMNSSGVVIDSITYKLEKWALARKDGVRADDPFGKWRGMSGISRDIRQEKFAAIKPFGIRTADTPSQAFHGSPSIHLNSNRGILQVSTDEGKFDRIEVRRIDGSMAASAAPKADNWSIRLESGLYVVRSFVDGVQANQAVAISR